MALHPTLFLAFVSICTFLGGTASAATARYALILSDDPAIARYSRAQMRTATAQSYRAAIESKQRALKAELRTRSLPVTGSVSTVLNAVFVVTSDDRRAELAQLPGVKGVVRLRIRQPKLNTAIQQMKGPAAWAALGGVDQSGRGMKIAILDTGIESTHPAFQDASLTIPTGFPRCSGGTFDCSKFTNNKVIVARSYVSMIAAGTGSDPSVDSRPDDYTPRDRVGHGTGTASCAAGESNTGVVTFSGMAPKAYLGNYKITGSPMVNEGAPDDVTLQAAEDAYNDGMDVISYSFGGAALTGPLEAGSICGNAAGVPCDPVAAAFDNLTKRGIVVVAAAGNEGSQGFNTISTPSNAPGVISVGALTNVHTFVETTSVVGGPPELQNMTVDLSDGSPFPGAITAPLRDVTQVGDDGYACTTIPVGYLNGTIALISLGPQNNNCTVAFKITNALEAGAVGVIIYDYPASTFTPSGFSSAWAPAVFVSNSEGIALKNYAAAHPGAQVIIDPNAIEQPAAGNQIASFSSVGPAGGALKPDVLATGTDIYMAAETYDPYGVLYSSNGYASAGGTSFATPIVSGAAALVKQKHPDWSPAQIKSAIVNTASQDVSGGFTVLTGGAGKLDAGAAVNAIVTVVPSTISYEILQSTTTLPLTQTLQVTNTSSSAVTLTVGVTPATGSPGGAVAVDKSTIPLAAGASDTLKVALSGPAPAAGNVYSGVVTLQGSGVSLRVPYMYAVGTGTPDAMIPLTGDNNDGTVGQGIPDGIISFKLVDANGVPVPGASVDWSPSSGVVLGAHDSITDANGVAAAEITLGTNSTQYDVLACVPSCASAARVSYDFVEHARNIPNIRSASSVVNAGDLQPNIAPGSYVAIMGANLSDFTDVAYTSILPLAIDYAAVSFDAPGLSIAAPLTYVSSTQVNVQVPWEFQGVDAAKVKVRIDFTNGNVVTVPLKPYAPALFQVGGGAAAAQLADYSLITTANPASRGKGIILYANGLGPVTNQPATGEPATLTLSRTTTTPIVMIGGKQAQVDFSGLTVGLAALYQLNVTVPPDAPTGVQPVTIAIGGVTSGSATIAIQ